jgi:hypothetical protein
VELLIQAHGGADPADDAQFASAGPEYRDNARTAAGLACNRKHHLVRRRISAAWHSADIRDADYYHGSASPDSIAMVQEEEPQPYASK